MPRFLLKNSYMDFGYATFFANVCLPRSLIAVFSSKGVGHETSAKARSGLATTLHRFTV